MGFHHLDQYARVESALTRRPPALRLAGTVVIALGAALLPVGAWPQLGLLGALALVLAAVARIRPRAFLVRFAPPFALVLLMSVGVLVLAPGEPVASLGPLAFTDTGLLRFGATAGRAAVALAAAVVLVSTTSFPELLRALRSFRLPEAVTTSLGLAYRYLYVLTDELGRLRRAARSRNAAVGAASRRRLLIGITAAGLQRSLARSERIHQAMLSRGYRGAAPPLTAPASGGRPVLELTLLAVLVAAIVGSAAL